MPSSKRKSSNIQFHTQAHGGLQIFINRLESEVDACRKEQPYEIRPPASAATGISLAIGDEPTQESETEMDVDTGAGSSTSPASQPLAEPIPGVTCLPQRAALLKSMLNFLKKAIQDSSFSDSIRHVMDGSLPAALKHIISNAEYYGPSLFLLGTDVVTVYVFQEPSLLSSLQDSGLTDVVLHALLVKDVPATREVLGSLPNVFSALCLNTRGLGSFVACKPFQRLFKGEHFLSCFYARKILVSNLFAFSSSNRIQFYYRPTICQPCAGVAALIRWAILPPTWAMPWMN